VCALACKEPTVAARPSQQLQLAKAIAAARTFLAEAAPIYLARPKALSGRIRSASELDQFIRTYRPTIATEDQEVFLAVALNSKHAPTRVIEIAKGTLGSVDVHPREAFRELIVHAAAATFFVHNHPSGDPEPSTDDIALTARLRDVGHLVGVPMLDHVIVGGDDYVSLADRGLL
jgi:DNA repair protein RadC